MPSAPSLRHIHPRRGGSATHGTNQQSRRQLSDNVLTNVSMIPNDFSEQPQQTTIAIPLSSHATCSGLVVRSPQQPHTITSTITPYSNMNRIPTAPPVYLESQRLMDSILVVSCIALHSYLLAYDRVYGGSQSNTQFYHYVKTPRGTLLRRFLLGRRTGLVSAEEFMQYGITFPSVTPSADSNTSLPPRFEYPVLRYPRISSVPVLYPINAPSIMLRKASWDVQVQKFLDYYRPHVYNPTSSSRGYCGQSSVVDRRTRHPRPPPMFPLRRPIHFSRNSAREIKPLPKRAQAAAARTSPATVLEVVTRTVVDIGSVIVRGAKRLKDGLEEGGILKKRRLL